MYCFYDQEKKKKFSSRKNLSGFALNGFGPGQQIPRTHFPALSQPLGECGPGGVRPRKRRAVVSRSCLPASAASGPEDLPGDPAAEVATCRQALRARTFPAYYAPGVGTGRGRTSASETAESREGRRPRGPSSRLPKLQPQSSRRGTAPARAPAEPWVTDGRWECGRSLKREL